VESTKVLPALITKTTNMVTDRGYTIRPRIQPADVLGGVLFAPLRERRSNLKINLNRRLSQAILTANDAWGDRKSFLQSNDPEVVEWESLLHIIAELYPDLEPEINPFL
jgi:hypothetical protein